MGPGKEQVKGFGSGRDKCFVPSVGRVGTCSGPLAVKRWTEDPGLLRGTHPLHPPHTRLLKAPSSRRLLQEGGGGSTWETEAALAPASAPRTPWRGCL